MPWSDKIPHATELLGLCAMAAEPARPEPVLRNRRGHNSERPAYRKNNNSKKKHGLLFLSDKILLFWVKNTSSNNTRVLRKERSDS